MINDTEIGGKNFSLSLIKAWVDLSRGEINIPMLIRFTGLPEKIIKSLVKELIKQGAIKEE